MLRIDVGVKEAHRDRIDAFLLQRRAGSFHARLPQLLVHFARGQYPLLDLPCQPARHQGPVAVEEQVVGFRPVAATDDVDVARATGDDQPGPGTLAFDERVDGNGRAMDEFVDGRGRDAALADAIDNALHEIGGRGQAFRLDETAGLVVETDQIREGAADVDRDKDHARTLLGSTCGPDGNRVERLQGWQPSLRQGTASRYQCRGGKSTKCSALPGMRYSDGNRCIASLTRSRPLATACPGAAPCRTSRNGSRSPRSPLRPG